VQVAVAFSPIDWVFDLASLAVGHDVFTGYKLSNFEKGAIILGLLTAGIGDDLLLMGTRASRYVDELGEGAVFAAKHADELEDAAHVVTRHGDELADAAHFTARYGEDAIGDARFARRLDEYVAGSDDSARLADDFGSACRYNSFTAGTPVETEDGPKPIEQIQEGDKVLAEDPETGEQGYFEVVALTNHPTDEILRITIEVSDDEEAGEQGADGTNNDQDDDGAGQEEMEITPDHPVYVEEEGWLLAENLTEGDRLRRADGGMAKVLAIERVHLDEPESVYNFTVRGPHTYFVLDAEVLVHNTGVCRSKWDENVQRFRDPQTGQFAKPPGREIDLNEASEFSGIPKNYLEGAQEVSGDTNVVCGLRQCNPKMNDLRTTTWPKDTGADVYHPVTGEKLKISSDAPIRFKTNEHGLVSNFELMSMKKIVNSDGVVKLNPNTGIPMGPDVDTNFFLKIEGSGVVNLGTGTADELYIRARLAHAMSDHRAGVNELVSAIGHGPGQPYFGTVETWGDTLVIMPDGRFIALQENEIETFFSRYGLTTYRKGPEGEYFVSNLVKDYDLFLRR
jgi:hypothetical protein